MAIMNLVSEIEKYVQKKLSEKWEDLKAGRELDKAHQTSGYCRALDELIKYMPDMLTQVDSVVKAEQLSKALDEQSKVAAVDAEIVS